MHLVIKTLMVIHILFILPDYALSDIFKCKDKNGLLHISDDPSKLPIECKDKLSFSTTKTQESISAKESLIDKDEIEKWTKLLPGTWELKGYDAGEPYVILWTIFTNGQFSGSGSGQAGKKTFTWRYSGTWKISSNDIISTYTWSSAPTPSTGTQDIDEIIELSESSLILRGRKTGSLSKYTRKR